MSHVLARAVGVQQTLEIDAIARYEPEPGDLFLLCSDGLHGVVERREIAAILESPGVTARGADWSRHACERGAPDNVTVTIVARRVDHAGAFRHRERS